MPWYRINFLDAASAFLDSAAIQADQLDRAIKMARRLAADRTPIPAVLEIWQGASRIHTERCPD